MKVIYKYTVPNERGTAIELPVDSQVVHVGLQRGDLMLWIEHGAVDANTRRAPRHFDVFGTGHEIPDDSRYVGTFFDGPFVFHVYETQYVAPTQVPL